MNPFTSILPLAMRSRQAGYSPAEAQVPMSVNSRVTTVCKGNSTEDVPCPAVTVGKLKEAIGKGYSPSLILEEIDKVPSTPFKLARLIELVDCVYEAQGQVIATSNASMSDLAAKWGADEAETILRRIGDGPGAITIKFE